MCCTILFSALFLEKNESKLNSFIEDFFKISKGE